MRTADDIWQDMDNLTAKPGNMSQRDVDRYMALETELTAVNESNVRQRHTAYNTVVVPAGVPSPRSGRGGDTLDTAFNALLRTGQPNGDLSHLKVSNAQGEGTGGAGGYLVPDGFRTKLIDRMKTFGGIANVVETITTETGNNLLWPSLDDTGNEGEIVQEHGTFTTGADLAFTPQSLGAYRYAAGGAGAEPLRVSIELIQDAAFDVEGLVSRKLGERIARVQAPHLISGTGVGMPQGIVYGRTGVELLNDTAGVTYDDLVNFIHAVDPAYRQRARWAFNDTALATLQKIKDSSGDPIWRTIGADMGTGIGGGTLLGYPVTIDQSFPNISLANNTINWGVFGDFAEGYVIRRVRDIVVVVNPWTRASYGQIEFSAWARMDAVQQNVNAYICLTGEQ